MQEINISSLIDGKLVKSSDHLEIISPLTHKPCGVVPALKSAEIQLAFAAARRSQPGWQNAKLLERMICLENFIRLLVDNKHKIAEIMAWEIGKSLKDGISEVERTIEYIQYTIEEARRIQPDTFTGDGFGVNNKIGIFRRVAKGVVLAISPYNYPINLAMSKIAPSLVTGNTVVFKPATQGSLTGAFLGELFYKANFPAGVINVVTGRGRDIGDELVTNKEVDLISFTGSVDVGQHIKKICGGKELILELGGKDPAIVFSDANLEKTAKEIVSGAFSYSGQRCTAIKRVLVDNKIADQLIGLLKPLIEKLKIGSPFDNNDIIPLIDMKTADFVQSLIDEALTKKAKLVIGNKREKNLLWPTLIDCVTSDMKLAWEEPFGPVLPIIRCSSVEEMVNIANKSNFGLQASIFTQDLSNALITAHKIEAGTVNINGKSQRGPDSFPFLGIKDSGQGVQGIRDTIMSVTRPQGIVINY